MTTPILPPPPGFVPDVSTGTDDNAGAQNISTQGAPAPALPSAVPPPPPGFVPDNSFTTPSGTTYTPGQQVQHSSGATGTVSGQSPDSGKALIDWSPITGFGKGIIETGQGIQHALGLDSTWWGGGPESHIDTTANGTGEQIGKAGETLAEFLTGDEALKALPVAQRMLTSGKILKTLESSPRLMQALRIGVGALRAGAVGGGQEYAKTGGDAGAALRTGTGAAIGAGVLGAAGSAVGSEAGDTVASNVGDVVNAAKNDLGETAQAIKAAPGKIAQVARKVYPEAIEPENVATADHNFQQTVQPLYDELHEGVRNAVADAAEKAGVTVKPTESIQDMAMDAAKAFRAKATKLYSQVDDAIEAATGRAGRFQAHDENLEALHDKLADSIGDTEAQAKYAKAIQEEEAAKQASLGHIKDAGLGDAPKQASALHKQGRALEDLGKKVQANTDGLPGDAGNPERLNPKTFATSLKNLKNNTRYGGSRLEQAIGPDNATTLIQQTNDTRTALRQAEQVEAQRVADRAAQAKRANVQRRIVQGLGTAGVAKATGLDKPILHAAEAIF